MLLNRRKKYLQIALNSTLEEAKNIILQLPPSDRILIEAGTPLIKAYGGYAIRQLKGWAEDRLTPYGPNATLTPQIFRELRRNNRVLGWIDRAFRNIPASNGNPAKTREKTNEMQINGSLPKMPTTYIVADMKTMDRGDKEVEIASRNGASAAIALGLAPIETIDSFIASCVAHNIDSMIDMMNVEYPVGTLRKLKKLPNVVMLHRGVDEEKFNKEKMLPLHEIRRIKGAYDVMISVAGGDTIREVQRAIFNDANIVVVWKEFYQKTSDTAALAKGFLQEIE
jgi:3-keto-L-gulonate-6-phosphate decarboxylase